MLYICVFIYAVISEYIKTMIILPPAVFVRCWWRVIYKCCDIAASLAACLVSLYCAVAGLAGGAFGVVLRYSARFVRYALNIGIYSRYGGILYPVPPPILKRENLGCLKFLCIYFLL